MTPAREEDVLARVRRSGVVAILRLRDHGEAMSIAQALAGADLRVMELTLDHPAALAALEAVAVTMGDDALVGAGTVRTIDQVHRAAAAGARFCVSPHVDAAIIGAALDAGLEPLPGACTATEVAAALDAGARAVKLFPAGPLGPAYMRALHGPFGDAAFIPTGGIRHEEVGTWLQAGALAVGLGSDLVPPRPAAEDVPGIAARAAEVVAAVARVRSDAA